MPAPNISRDGLLICCSNHQLDTSLYLLDCPSCLLKCRGRCGCGKHKPVSEFQPQYRINRPIVTSVSLWEAVCKDCATANTNKGSGEMELVAQEKDLGGGVLQALQAVDGAPVLVMRQADGYFNLTKILSHSGKRMDHWKNEKEVKDYLTVWPDFHPTEQPYHQVTGGEVCMGMRGTWAHPQLAIYAATRCNAAFGRAVFAVVDRYLQGKVTTAESAAAARTMNPVPQPGVQPFVLTESHSVQVITRYLLDLGKRSEETTTAIQETKGAVQQMISSQKHITTRMAKQTGDPLLVPEALAKVFSSLESFNSRFETITSSLEGVRTSLQHVVTSLSMLDKKVTNQAADVEALPNDFILFVKEVQREFAEQRSQMQQNAADQRDEMHLIASDQRDEWQQIAAEQRRVSRAAAECFDADAKWDFFPLQRA